MSYLRVYLGNELKDQFELTTDRLTIGRSKDNDLSLNDSRISSHHAVILREGARFIIEDKESTNGVFINNKRIQRSELKYWDEIQICNYVLKFMALTALGGADDEDVANQDYVGEFKTQIVDLSKIDLLSLVRQELKSAYFILRHPNDEETRFPFSQQVTFTIGRSKDSDIRTKGWFSPRTAAEVEHSKLGYHLIPCSRGKVRLNGEQIQAPSKLKDGDDIEVRELSLRFFYRAIEK